ncbi:MAG TPA: hypothetical protein VME86_17705 [Acidobacteriaceae bacterium]|nr:hypothetical protein [Acidobacteriaceae bacterium]
MPRISKRNVVEILTLLEQTLRINYLLPVSLMSFVFTFGRTCSAAATHISPGPAPRFAC